MKTLRVGAVLFCLLAAAQAQPQQADAVEARWQAREVQATFAGLRTAYNCEAVEHRIRRLLLDLGAHPRTTVLVTGCAINRIAGTFFVHISTATSVPIGQSEASDAKEELLRRLGSSNAYGDANFPAVWKTTDLTKLKELHFEAGDCELLQLIENQILPKLGAEVPSKRLQCAPGTPLTRLPAINVTMLTPAAAVDAKTK